MTTDHIQLRIPGDGRYTTVLRLAATQLAAQTGFDTDGVEDVRVAVSEAARILGRDDPTVPLTTAFSVHERGFMVSVSRAGEPPDVDERSRRILRAMTRRHRIGRSAEATASVSMDFTQEPEIGP